MNINMLVFWNALSIFPIHFILSSMKVILGQCLKIGFRYNTMVSYAGIIACLRFLCYPIIQRYSIPFFGKKKENWQQYAFLGNIIMMLSILFIYLITISYRYFNSDFSFLSLITFFAIFTVIGEGIYDSSISFFYTQYKNSSQEGFSSQIFFGHKLAALLGYFFLPFLAYYVSLDLSFILAILTSIIAGYLVFYLPKLEQKQEEKKQEDLKTIIKTMIVEIKNTENIGKILLFTFTCQFSLLCVHGIKTNFVANASKNLLFIFLLRGLAIGIGIAGGFLTRSVKKRLYAINMQQKDRMVFLLGSILHLIVVLLNYYSMQCPSKLNLFISEVAENLSKGFVMFSLTSFFLSHSNKKPYLLTFFWGFFQIVRSVAGGISGPLLVLLGLKQFFFLLVLMCIPPIFIALSLNQKTNY